MPAASAKNLSHFYIKLDGQDAPAELMTDILEVQVESSLHLPDVAMFVVSDPRLKWIDSSSLQPGRKVEISARSEIDEKTLFDGEIVEVEPGFTMSTQRLTIRAFDRLHRLARGRQARTFVNMSDDDIVQKIAGEVGLSASVGPARQIYPYVIQPNQTNLEFLRRRAVDLGYLLYVEGSTLYFAPPAATEDSVEAAWNENLASFRPRMTTIDQINTVTARGWDPDAKKAVVGQSSDSYQSPPKVGFSDSGGQAAKSAFNVDAPYLMSDRPLRSQGAAERLATAVAEDHAGRFIEAEGTVSGEPKLRAGSQITIKNVGTTFGGTYLITSATHRFTRDEGYMTDFSVSAFQAASILRYLTEGAAGGVDSPGYLHGGVVIGVVTDNQDPEGRGRVKVMYPWLSDEHTSYWARLCTPGAGPDRGVEFLPEVNDEVLLSFEQGDMNHAYVLGGLWNGSDDPPKKSSEIVSGGKVQQRIIQSRTGHFFLLDDADGAGGITIQDRKGNVIKIESRDDSLTIEVAGNATVKAKDISVEASGRLDMTSQTGMSFQTQGNMDIKAQGQIDINSEASISVESQGPIDVQSQATVDINGQAQVSVESSGMVGIQGSMVSIN